MQTSLSCFNIPFMGGDLRESEESNLQTRQKAPLKKRHNEIALKLIKCISGKLNKKGPK